MMLTFEPKRPVNKVRIYPNSGLLMAASEHTKIGTYFIPSLGHAPKFCQFIENFTEELESQNKTDILPEHKFITF